LGRCAKHPWNGRIVAQSFFHYVGDYGWISLQGVPEIRLA
jgi:hypothetical protein